MRCDGIRAEQIDGAKSVLYGTVLYCIRLGELQFGHIARRPDGQRAQTGRDGARRDFLALSLQPLIKLDSFRCSAPPIARRDEKRRLPVGHLLHSSPLRHRI